MLAIANGIVDQGCAAHRSARLEPRILKDDLSLVRAGCKDHAANFYAIGTNCVDHRGSSHRSLKPRLRKLDAQSLQIADQRHSVDVPKGPGCHRDNVNVVFELAKEVYPLMLNQEMRRFIVQLLHFVYDPTPLLVRTALPEASSEFVSSGQAIDERRCRNDNCLIYVDEHNIDPRPRPVCPVPLLDLSLHSSKVRCRCNTVLEVGRGAHACQDRANHQTE
mmetsp:Transcript_23976/g.67923  ORF Transcript_23976/g.67923 Transcript_23976/m.67923 type:complete len:220 (-) Transcript_23976:107-766(-)